MYQRDKSAWIKHLDFIILDVLCMQIAYIASFMIRHGFIWPYEDPGYRNIGIIIILVQICTSLFLELYEDILRRSRFQELKNAILSVTIVVVFVLVYFFVTKTSSIYSRAVFLELWIIGTVFIYGERIVWKTFIRKRMKDKRNLQSLVVFSTSKRAENTLAVMKQKAYTGFYIRGIILSDVKESNGKTVTGIPVIAGAEKALTYLKENVVDEVFIDLPDEDNMKHAVLNACEEMGITTHVNLGRVKNIKNATTEIFADHLVLTTSISFAEPRDLIIKRLMDIVGGIIGLAITAVLTVIFGPIIYIQSPGPIFFSQERVGRNGRRFRIYKFRSMYPDAEERKKELMSQNKMRGLMFKIDDDPRIIPIGHFMRKTSLDEFPQFFNVLKGNMSLVGTRPPTVDEYEKYEMHHKARLAAKPGLTGMWQVSGRSNIVDFEEVVRLDKEYIENWNLGMDFKILLRTIKVILTGKGSV